MCLHSAGLLRPKDRKQLARVKGHLRHRCVVRSSSPCVHPRDPEHQRCQSEGKFPVVVSLPPMAETHQTGFIKGRLHKQDSTRDTPPSLALNDRGRGLAGLTPPRHLGVAGLGCGAAVQRALVGLHHLSFHVVLQRPPVDARQAPPETPPPRSPMQKYSSGLMQLLK